MAGHFIPTYIKTLFLAYLLGFKFLIVLQPADLHTLLSSELVVGHVLTLRHVIISITESLAQVCINLLFEMVNKEL